MSYIAFVLVSFLFDEVFRPMRGVDMTEMVLWYFSRGAAFLMIPGLPIFLLHRKLDSPKKTTLIFGAVLMTFSLLMTALHLTST